MVDISSFREGSVAREIAEYEAQKKEENQEDQQEERERDTSSGSSRSTKSTDDTDTKTERAISRVEATKSGTVAREIALREFAKITGRKYSELLKELNSSDYDKKTERAISRVEATKSGTVAREIALREFAKTTGRQYSELSSDVRLSSVPSEKRFVKSGSGYIDTEKNQTITTEEKKKREARAKFMTNEKRFVKSGSGYVDTKKKQSISESGRIQRIVEEEEAKVSKKFAEETTKPRIETNKAGESYLSLPAEPSILMTQLSAEFAKRSPEYQEVVAERSYSRYIRPEIEEELKKEVKKSEERLKKAKTEIGRANSAVNPARQRVQGVLNQGNTL